MVLRRIKLVREHDDLRHILTVAGLTLQDSLVIEILRFPALERVAVRAFPREVLGVGIRQ
jgi:hypothetical protein